LERLSGADRRARLDRDLLDEAHYQHHGRDQALRWVLDEDGLPDSRQDIPFGGAVHFAGDGSHYANHRDRRELAHHKPGRWSAHQGGTQDGHKRDRLGRRLSVEISADNGKSWREASLGEDPGKFAFRAWSYEFIPKRRGKSLVAARAANKIGQIQTQELIQNPAGDNDNVPQTVTLHVS
jgi:hypothetical protein